MFRFRCDSSAGHNFNKDSDSDESNSHPANCKPSTESSSAKMCSPLKRLANFETNPQYVRYFFPTIHNLRR